MMTECSETFQAISHVGMTVKIPCVRTVSAAIIKRLMFHMVDLLRRFHCRAIIAAYYVFLHDVHKVTCFNLIIAGHILVKFGMDIMPLEAT
jgi:hypothetical protein